MSEMGAVVVVVAVALVAIVVVAMRIARWLR